MHSNHTSHFLDIALKILVILTPTLVSLVLVLGFTDRKYNVYTPMLQDEIEYWREAVTFKEVAFNGGYYTYNEVPGQADAIHYSGWGPAYPVLAGTLGKIFGWGWASGPLLNTGLITLALAFYVLYLRPDRRKLLALLLVMATFWPVIAYLPITMQESLNQAIGIVLAGVFYKVISTKGYVSGTFLLAASAFIFLAGLVRPTWAVLYLPLFAFSRLPFSRWVNRGVKLLASVVLSAPCFGLLLYWAAPAADDPKNLFKLSSLSWSSRLAFYAQNISVNVGSFRYDTSIIALEHVQIFVLLLGCAITGILFYRRWAEQPSTDSAEVLFHLFNIGGLFFFNLVFYLVPNDFRILSGHILLSVLLLIAFGHFRSVVAFALSNFLAIIAILSFYITYVTPHFWIDPDQLATFRQNTAPLVRYQPDQSAWCNTLLTPEAFAPEILVLPPQIGESFLTLKDAKISADLKWPLKSRYLLLDDATYAQMKDRLHVEKLQTIALGTLYLNRDAPCPRDQE